MEKKFHRQVMRAYKGLDWREWLTAFGLFLVMMIPILEMFCFGVPK